VTSLIPRLQSLSTYSWGDKCDTYNRNCLPGLNVHGDYCSGLNKDSYVRPLFEASYAFAFAGTVEWIYNIEQWAQESPNGITVLNDARNYMPSADDAADLKKTVAYSIEISYATKTVHQDDGHWKGAGSGDYSRFLNSAIEFIASTNIYKDQYAQKKFYLSLVNPTLYDYHGTSSEYSDAVEVIVPYSQLPSQLRSYRKVKVRTWIVDIPDKVNTPSPYATVTIGNQTLEENVMADNNEFYPHWTSISFVPSNIDVINIQYTLWNDKFPADDTQIPIMDDNDGSMNAMYNIVTGTFESGDVTGRYDSRYNVLELQSGSNSVSLYIITQQFGNCTVTGFPNIICDDEAYSQLFLSNYCGLDKGTDSAATLPVSISLITILFLILLHLAINF